MTSSLMRPQRSATMNIRGCGSRLKAGTTRADSIFKELKRHAFAFSRRDAPEVCLNVTLLKIKRAQGKPDADCTRGSRATKARGWDHRFNRIIRLSLRSGFTAYFVLSPVTGLFCHRRFADTPAKLDASVGASGPHDFAVRSPRRSSKA
jgi:hypothetical protein